MGSQGFGFRDLGSYGLRFFRATGLRLRASGYREQGVGVSGPPPRLKPCTPVMIHFPRNLVS